jgi:hypothetical protein
MKRNAEFSQAVASDAEALLRLIESQPAKGDLEILYTRRPDPILSYRKESDDVSLGVLRDGEGRPCFMEATVFRPYYIGGVAMKLGYLGGVKQRPEAPARVNWMRAMYDYEVAKAKGFYCSILSANEAARKLLTKKRPYMPPVRPICEYSTFLIHPKALLCAAGGVDAVSGGLRENPDGSREDLDGRPQTAGCLCGVSYEEQKAEINGFLNDFGRAYNFFPVIEDIPAQLTGVRGEDMFVLREGAEIVAFAALWDQASYRQNLLVRYRGIMRIAGRFSALSTALKYMPFPKEGSLVRFACLALVCVKDRDPKLLQKLLHAVGREALARGYEIVVHGLPSGSWQAPVLKKIRKVKFDSNLYWMQPRDATAAIALEDRPAHFEVGWL